MFTNDDKQFLSDLNDSLAKSFSDALNSGAAGAASPTPQKDKENTDAVNENTESSKLNTAGMSLLGVAFKGAVQVLSKSLDGAVSFGDTLARSSTATGKSLDLAGAKFDSATGAFTNQLPGVSESFRKFSFSVPEMGRMLDSAIRANVRDTSKNTQRFIATAAGLGNNVGTINTFLATQTNALGISTEATTALGDQILATAHANGMVADSLFEVVNSLKELNKAQEVVFGPEMAEFTKELGIVFETLAPGTDIQSVLKTLLGTDPRTRLQVGSLMGIDVPQRLTPQNATRFIEEALTVGIDNLQGRIRQQSNDFGAAAVKDMQAALGASESFTHSLGVLGKAFRERQTNLRTLMSVEKLSTRETNDAAETQRRMSNQLATNSLLFNNQLKALEGVNEALDKLVMLMGDEMPKSASTLEKYFYGINTGLRQFGTSIEGIIVALGGMALLRGGSRALFSRAAAGATAAGTRTAVAGASRASLTSAMSQRQLAKHGMKLNSAGNVVWKDAASAAKFGAKPGTVSTAILQKVAKPGMAARALGAGSKMAGSKVPVVGGLISGGFEYAESGDISRAITRGGVTAGSTIAGAAIGQALIPIPFVGAGVGFLAGLALDHFVGDAAVEAHDALGFYENPADAVNQVMNETGMGEGEIPEDGMEEQRIHTSLLEGIYENTLGGANPAVPTRRMEFNVPTQWNGIPGGYFPGQRGGN